MLSALVVGLLPVRAVQARGASRPVAQPSAPEVAAAPADGQVVLGSQPAPGFAFSEWVTATAPMVHRQAQGPASAEAGETAPTVLHLPLVLAPQQVQGPQALAMVASPLLGLAPLTVTVTALRQAQGSYEFAWDFGDGAGADGPASQHVFTTVGVYTITLRAYNELDEQVVTQPVRVYDPAAVRIEQVDEQGGRVMAQEGDLWLDFAPGAVREPHYVYIQQVNLTSITTDTVDGTPALEVPGFGLPFRQVKLHAARVSDGLWQTHTEFAAPVTITHAYHPEIVEQLLPQSLHFTYWNATTNGLEPLTSTVHPALGQVWAPLQHFSEYGVAGENAAWQTPTLDAAEVSLAKGQSSYGYALPLPAGPAGFAPKVNLSYSSALPNSKQTVRFQSSSLAIAGEARLHWKPLNCSMVQAILARLIRRCWLVSLPMWICYF